MKYERIIMMITLVALFGGALDMPLLYAREGVMKLFDLLLGWVPFL